MVKQVVAALQIGSSLDGTSETLKKILSYEDEIKRSGASLVVLPEATLGGYPKGSLFGTYLGYRLQSGREEFANYYNQAIKVGSDDGCTEIKELEGFSRRIDASVVIGVIERDGTSLYCTMVFIDPYKGYVGKHRKLQPTASERLIWGQGDGSTLTTVSSKVGWLGGAICWENQMPLLRQAMYAKGVQVWCAPTVDSRPIWRTVMQNIAYEGRIFLVSAVQFVPDATKMGLGEVVDEKGTRKLPGWPNSTDNVINGGSVIVNPYGEILAGPLTGEEGLITAEIDLDTIIEAKFDFDVVGHYARGDVFKLRVNESSNAVEFY